MELARRVWVTVVLDGNYSPEHKSMLHGLVRGVLDGQMDMDAAIYDLAVGLGLPPLRERGDNPGIVRVMSIQHIVSMIQCSVMILSRSSEGSKGVQDEEISPQMAEKKKLSDMVRELGRIFDDNEEQDTSAAAIFDRLCHHIEDSKSKLPEGFFDPMISPEVRNSWTQEQEATLTLVSDKLAQETRLRQKMMVDRALATLKSFSSSQLIRGNPGLVRVLDSYTEEAKETMEMMCASKLADIDDAFRTTKGEIVSLLMGNTFDHGMSQKRTAKVKTITIGSVPNRGGRPEGVSRAAALMPSWQKRKAATTTNEKNHHKNPKKKFNNKNKKNNT